MWLEVCRVQGRITHHRVCIFRRCLLVGGLASVWWQQISIEETASRVDKEFVNVDIIPVNVRQMAVGKKKSAALPGAMLTPRR